MTSNCSFQAIINAITPSRCFRQVGATALAVMLVLSCAQAAQAKSGYYQWRDEQGQMHFSQRPPSSSINAEQTETNDANAEFVPQQKGSMFARESSDSDTKRNKQVVPETAPKIAAGSDSLKTPSRPFEKDKQRCEDAKNNLAELSKTFRIRYTDENGKQRLLSAEEKQQQRQSALKAIEESC